MYNCKLIELFNLLIVLIFDSDNGMKYMIGDDWRSLFDVIVVQARKPSFFKKESRYFFLDFVNFQIQIHIISYLDHFERSTWAMIV